MTAADDGISQIDELILKVNALPDPAARAVAVELVQAVMRLHATALQQVLDLVSVSAPEVVGRLAADETVSRVLVLHGIHPDNFDQRFARALDRLQHYFDSRGAHIEVLDASAELVRVRFQGRPGSGAAARKVIEDAVYEAAPEVGELIVEGTEVEHEPGFVPLESLLATQPA